MTAKFTVRQIYLLTELKNSGLSNEEILQGLTDIDTVVTHRPTFSFHNSTDNLLISSPPYPTTASPSNGTMTNGIVVPNSPTITKRRAHHSKVVAVRHTTASPAIKRARSSNSNFTTGTGTSSSSSKNSRVRDDGFISMVYQQPAAMSGGAAAASSEEMLVRAERRRQSREIHDQRRLTEMAAADKQLDPEVYELMQRDVNEVKDEIQRFMSANRFTQSYIVKCCGTELSQPYISCWLLKPRNRNYRKISLLYQWYVNEKRGLLQNHNNNNNGSMMLPPTKQLNGSSIINQSDEMDEYEEPSEAIWPSLCEDILEERYQGMKKEEDDEGMSGMKAVEVAVTCTNRLHKHYHQQGRISRELVTARHVQEWFVERQRRSVSPTSSPLPRPLNDDDFNVCQVRDIGL